MELKEVQRNWDAFGKTDPLWAIVTQPGRRHGTWGRDDFFALGMEEIDRILRHVNSLSFPLRRGRALDFGCGVGRLTQALCRHFDRCDGIDIAPSMIDLARQYNQHGNRCRYAVNDYNDLAVFNDDTFDFIYSSLVLQHMRPEYSRNYVREFLRVLAPGGLAVFQIPSRLTAESESPYRARIRAQQTSVTASPGSRITIPVRVQNLSDFTWPAINLGNHWLSDVGTMLVYDDARASLPLGMKPSEEVEVAITVTAPKKADNYLLELDLVQEGVLWFRNMGSATATIPCLVYNARHAVSALYGKLQNRLRASTGYRLGSKVFRRLSRSIQSWWDGSQSRPTMTGSIQSWWDGSQSRPTMTGERASTPPGENPASGPEPVMEMYSIPKEELLSFIQSLGGKVVDVAKDHSAGRWESFHYYITRP